MSVQIEIVGAGAYIASAGSDRRRPYRRGANVVVDDWVAEKLIESRVAVRSDQAGSIEEPVGLSDGSTDDEFAEATIDEILGFVSEDQERAARVLSVEEGKDKPRKTLVEKLEAIVDDGEGES